MVCREENQPGWSQQNPWEEIRWYEREIARPKSILSGMIYPSNPLSLTALFRHTYVYTVSLSLVRMFFIFPSPVGLWKTITWCSMHHHSQLTDVHMSDISVKWISFSRYQISMRWRRAIQCLHTFIRVLIMEEFLS